MKTISLKMLLVAALVANPAVIAHEGCGSSTSEVTPVATTQVDPVATMPEAPTYMDLAKDAASKARAAAVTAGERLVQVSGEAYAWVNANKGTTAAVVAAAITAVAAKKVYNWATAPAKTAN